MNCPTCRLSLLDDTELGMKRERRARRMMVAMGPQSRGLWGVLHTGQVLLDLFGGWEPQGDID